MLFLFADLFSISRSEISKALSCVRELNIIKYYLFIYILFEDATNIADYKVSSDLMTESTKLERK